MSTTATSVRSTITLKGSTETVTEFFQYAVSSILYQRGIYPPENFEPKKQYGLTVMSVKDTKLAEYLNTVLRQFSGRREGLQLVLNYNLNIATLEEQLWWYSIQVEAHYAHTPYSDWLATGTLQKVVLVVTAVGSRDVLERWAFDIETDADVISTQCVPRWGWRVGARVNTNVGLSCIFFLCSGSFLRNLRHRLLRKFRPSFGRSPLASPFYLSSATDVRIKYKRMHHVKSPQPS